MAFEINQPQGLILLAHGSRNPKVPDEMAVLVSGLAKQASVLNFKRVEAAFLELIDPRLDEIVGQYVAAGIQRIVVLPYFLMMGNHVERDIPKQIALLKSEYPEIEIQMLDYFGSNPLFSHWLSEHLQTSLASAL